MEGERHPPKLRYFLLEAGRMDIVMRCDALVKFTQGDKSFFLEEVGQEGDAVGKSLFAQTDRQAEGRVTG
jgi:hypothetical protein